MHSLWLLEVLLLNGMVDMTSLSQRHMHFILELAIIDGTCPGLDLSAIHLNSFLKNVGYWLYRIWRNLKMYEALLRVECIQDVVVKIRKQKFIHTLISTLKMYVCMYVFMFCLKAQAGGKNTNNLNLYISEWYGLISSILFQIFTEVFCYFTIKENVLFCGLDIQKSYWHSKPSSFVLFPGNVVVNFHALRAKLFWKPILKSSHDNPNPNSFQEKSITHVFWSYLKWLHFLVLTFGFDTLSCNKYLCAYNVPGFIPCK